MNKIALVKFAAKLIVGAGTSKLAKDAIVNNTHTPVTTVDKITMNAGALVVGAMASEASTSWTDRKIDELVAAYQDLKVEVSKAKK